MVNEHEQYGVVTYILLAGGMFLGARYTWTNERLFTQQFLSSPAKKEKKNTIIIFIGSNDARYYLRLHAYIVMDDWKI